MALVTDIFNQNAFGAIEFQEQIVARVDYRPQLLGSLNLFEPIYSRSSAIGIVASDSTMKLIPTSELGAPPAELDKEGKNVRLFKTVRLAKGSTIHAYELAGVVSLPTDQQFVEITQEVVDRTRRITDDMELTWEHMRLGAIHGKVYDSNGTTVLYDWYSEWGMAEPAEINFALATADTDLRKICRDVKRQMQKAAKGVWTPATRVGALVGDEFYDKLVNHPAYKEAKLGTPQAAALENIEGYSAVEFEGILFINYRGTDDGTTLAIGSTKARFFPINARGAFQVGWGPANEFKPYLNRRGQERYGLVLADTSGRDAWDRVEQYSYPLFACTRPQMLLRGKL